MVLSLSLSLFTSLSLCCSLGVFIWLTLFLPSVQGKDQYSMYTGVDPGQGGSRLPHMASLSKHDPLARPSISLLWQPPPVKQVQRRSFEPPKAGRFRLNADLYRFHAVSTLFQRHFNAVLTPFQPRKVPEEGIGGGACGGVGRGNDHMPPCMKPLRAWLLAVAPLIGCSA